jgi:hypothetical protein
MGRTRRSRRSISILLIAVLLVWVTGLFGAGQSAKITVPPNKSRVSGIIDIKAEVNAGRSLAYVVLVVDELRPASTNSSPCTFELDTRELSDGPHQLFIEAYDTAGLITASKAVTIYVKNEAPEPAVVVKQPLALKTTARARVAKAPAGPPAKTAAGAAVMPKTITTAEPARPAASAAPVIGMRGPAPEPTRTAAITIVAPRSADRAEAAAVPGAMGVPNVTTPPIVKVVGAARSGRIPAVMVNGRPVTGDVDPVVVNGRMHGGLRALFAAIGARISWLSGARTARVVSGSLTIEVPVGSRMAKVNGAQVDMGGPARIVNGRTVVPVRFFADATGAQISWDADTGAAKVWTPAGAIARNVP